jgi:hypothetical protein
MSLLTQNVKRINSLKKNRDKEIDRIGKTRDKMSKKSTKRLEESLNKGEEKLTSIESLFGVQREQIETIISEIELSLASGRRL